jgi:hypothetical protein
MGWPTFSSTSLDDSMDWAPCSICCRSGGCKCTHDYVIYDISRAHESSDQISLIDENQKIKSITLRIKILGLLQCIDDAIQTYFFNDVLKWS